MDILQTKDVVKRYANHLALDRVSITIPEGAVYGLLGPNGAGKTTLIRIINQITGPDEGEVWLNGEKLSPEHITQIGYLPEERGLYKKMKVGDQAVYLAQLKGLSKAEAVRRLKYWFEKFDILSWWDRKVEELSKGMQQKIQFVVTVLHEPKLLIFDEPFSGFDPINAQLLRDEILGLRDRGATVIFSTHNMASVEEVCDRIALINRSHKILEGRVDEIRNSFHANLYEVVLETQEKADDFLGRDLEVLDVQPLEKPGRLSLKLKMTQGNATNALLQHLMAHGQVCAFKEVLPSMNDIFIQTVKQANEDEQK